MDPGDLHEKHRVSVRGIADQLPIGKTLVRVILKQPIEKTVVPNSDSVLRRCVIAESLIKFLQHWMGVGWVSLS